jgi:hypothetical protein
MATLGCHQAIAQSTLFNIPSTDAVAEKKAYFEFDYMRQMPKNASRNDVYAPRIVFGAGRGVEAGVNLTMFRNVAKSGSSTQSYLQPNLKWRFAANDDEGLAASTGTILNIATNNRDSVDEFFGLWYANFSKKIKSTDNGPRFTFGPYAVYSGGDSWVGPDVGAIAAIEQPVGSKVTLLADWFSGKNFYGYFTPGVSFTLPKSSLLNIGYSIGNDSWTDPSNNNRLLFVYWGITFPEIPSVISSRRPRASPPPHFCFR